MAIDFSHKVMVTNPTLYYLGQVIACVGVIILIVGIVTQFTGDLFIPASAWCALAIPTAVVGGIFVWCGLTKR
jgi:hypothetical protein